MITYRTFLQGVSEQYDDPKCPWLLQDLTYSRYLWLTSKTKKKGFTRFKWFSKWGRVWRKNTRKRNSVICTALRSLSSEIEAMVVWILALSTAIVVGTVAITRFLTQAERKSHKDLRLGSLVATQPDHPCHSSGFRVSDLINNPHQKHSKMEFHPVEN